MRIFALIITSAILVLSCDKKETIIKSEVADPVVDSIQVVDSTVNGVNSEATPVVMNNSGDRPALNPEHGQPHHRCEIPVGAPIDSAPEQNVAPQPVPQQLQSNNGFNTTPISPALSPSTAAGPKPSINPPHGEEYHRCDLQVGAPLT